MRSADVVTEIVDVSDRAPTSVVFRLPPEFGGLCADVAGDFSAWVPLAMERQSGGGFTLGLRLLSGFRWRYRFLIDGVIWINDPNACEFVVGSNGAAVSVLVT